MDDYSRDSDAGAWQGQGDETRPPQGAGGAKDARGVPGCALAGISTLVVVVGYVVSVNTGFVLTFFCTPLYIAAIVLSWRSMIDGAPGRWWALGLLFGVGGLLCTWVFGAIVELAGFFIALDPSLIDTMGSLALLNWGCPSEFGGGHGRA